MDKDEKIKTLLEYASPEELTILLNLAESVVQQVKDKEPFVLPT